MLLVLEASMKKRAQCPKCDGTKIGKLGSLPDLGHGNRPAQRVIGGIGQVGLFGGGYEAQGLVEAYVCTECGYFEEYVVRPTEVPWDQMNDFEWVESAAGAAFR